MTFAQNLELPKIIKRLELIKSLISLEEEEELAMHISKLQQLPLNEEVENIIKLLQQKSYSQAMPAIDRFINQHHQLASYIDPEIDGLKLEAKILEAELNLLSNEKGDLEKLIHEFGVRHNQELGELILKILQSRKSKAKGTPQEKDAEKDYTDYSNEYEKTKEERIVNLSEEEQKELKNKYHKACWLCHPDIVKEEQKQLANKMQAELNEAYKQNNLERVREILENLQNGNFFVCKSDVITEKQLMKAEIEKLRLKINELKNQVLNIKESESFKTVSSISDWDDYFAQTKQKLTEQANSLEDGRE